MLQSRYDLLGCKSVPKDAFMAATTLKRFGKTNYSGMLTAIGTPHWAEETKLLRFVEKNGCSTVFTITKEALRSFSHMEMWRIYDIEVPGKCVRTCTNQSKTGVHNNLEVRAAFPLVFTLSKTAWPCRATYAFVDWEDLNQKPNDSFVDLVGRVLSAPILDQNSTLAKLHVELGFQDMHQTVVMLGMHANNKLKENDILAIGGLKIKEWQHERTLETSFVTMVEVNPSPREGLEILENIGNDEPKKKVMRASLPDVARVKDVMKMEENLLRKNDTSESTEFVLIGKLTPMDNNFFVEDPPLLGDNQNEKMCWRTKLTDETGWCGVKVWDKPCYTLFQLTAPGLRAMWEEGLEHEQKREAILEQLNRNLTRDIRCVCKMNIWTFGAQSEKRTAQINVNLIDDADR